MTLDQIKNQIRPIVKKRLDTNVYDVFIFGSRPGGFSGPYSDVDIGIEGPRPVPTMTIAELKGDFTRSNLPFFVDVVDFSTVSDEFKSIAKRHVSYL